MKTDDRVRKCEIQMWRSRFHMRCFVFTCGYSHVHVKAHGHFTQEHFHFYVKKRLNCEHFQFTCELIFLFTWKDFSKYSVHMWHSDWYVKNLEKCPVQKWNYVIFTTFLKFGLVFCFVFVVWWLTMVICSHLWRCLIHMWNYFIFTC